MEYPKSTSERDTNLVFNEFFRGLQLWEGQLGLWFGAGAGSARPLAESAGGSPCVPALIFRLFQGEFSCKAKNRGNIE